MIPVVTDTHSFLWYFLKPERLSPVALEAYRDATRTRTPIHVPSICIVEVAYLTEKNRLPPIAYMTLCESVRNPDTVFKIAELNFDVAVALKRIPRDVVPDMPDRIIAATALVLDLPLITCDSQIRRASIKTIW